jgi:hypothetical protein
MHPIPSDTPSPALPPAPLTPETPGTLATDAQALEGANVVPLGPIPPADDAAIYSASASDAARASWGADTLGAAGGLLSAEAEERYVARFSTHGPLLGQHVIVRASQSGVWFGVLQFKDSTGVRLQHARRLWRWWAGQGVSLSGVAVAGLHPEKLRDCKIEPPVDVVVVEGACEILLASERAVASISAAPVRLS